MVSTNSLTLAQTLALSLTHSTHASPCLFTFISKFSGNSQWELLSTSFISGRYTTAPPVGWDSLNKSLPNDVISIQSKGKFIYFNLNNGTIWNTLG